MSEYLEAISRLEVQERPPRIRYIKQIPFGEYPNHKTTAKWNKVFSDGRFSKLPKYSIPQRFYITKNELGHYVYDFKLDKTFTTAVGDRKSIAIRGINFTHALKEVSVELSGNLSVPKDATYYKDGTIHTVLAAVTKESDKDILAYNQSQLLNAIMSVFVNCFTQYFGSEFPDVINQYSYNVDTSKIVIKLNHITQGDEETKWNFRLIVKALNNSKINI